MPAFSAAPSRPPPPRSPAAPSRTTMPPTAAPSTPTPPRPSPAAALPTTALLRAVAHSGPITAPLSLTARSLETAPSTEVAPSTPKQPRSLAHASFVIRQTSTVGPCISGEPRLMTFGTSAVIRLRVTPPLPAARSHSDRVDLLTAEVRYAAWSAPIASLGTVPPSSGAPTTLSAVRPPAADLAHLTPPHI